MHQFDVVFRTRKK